MGIYIELLQVCTTINKPTGIYLTDNVRFLKLSKCENVEGHRIHIYVKYKNFYKFLYSEKNIFNKFSRNVCSGVESYYFFPLGMIV